MVSAKNIFGVDPAQSNALLFNFCASLAIIFINKLLFESFRFPFATFLTLTHYIIQMIGLEVLAAAGVYERRSSPMTPRILILGFVVGAAPALNNMSLKLNGLGFYQVVKLLVTPGIVGLEASLYGATLSSRRALALGMICLGVSIACVNDLSLNATGCAVAALWVPIAAVYKVLWSRESKECHWHTFALMRRVLPLSTLVLLLLTPLSDPPGLLHFHWTLRRVAMVLASGAAAFMVNWSGFLVMGACSALTHTVLGQASA